MNLTRSKVTVEMLRVEKGAPPRLLHRLTHSTHSLPAVVATMKTMLPVPRTPGLRWPWAPVGPGAV